MDLLADAPGRQPSNMAFSASSHCGREEPLPRRWDFVHRRIRRPAAVSAATQPAAVTHRAPWLSFSPCTTISEECSRRMTSWIDGFQPRRRGWQGERESTESQSVEHGRHVGDAVAIDERGDLNRPGFVGPRFASAVAMATFKAIPPRKLR